jgi:hypothetical protein
MQEARAISDIMQVWVQAGEATHGASSRGDNRVGASFQQAAQALNLKF